MRNIGEYRSGRSTFFRHAMQRRGALAAFMVTGFVAGIAGRILIDSAATRDPANYLRSGLHGIGVAVAAWAVQIGFAATARATFGATIRQLPVSSEVIVRSLAMTLVLIMVGVFLQLVIYAEPLRLYWFTWHWFTTTLPWIVAIGFVISLIIGMITETGRLIGGPMLTSVLLGTYRRPTRKQRIVMFLDIAGSTRLAEEMGELRVHDLITRFFFDIDEPIGNHAGAVHAYVGDEVIVTWPVTGDPVRDARCLACFFAIERKMARLASGYEHDFDIVPGFRAGLHTGPVIVSECGDARRQLAYFGDTMNVAARLCEYCKAVDQRLIVSGDLLRLVAIPVDLRVGHGESIALRGRQAQIETYAISSSRQTPVVDSPDFGVFS